ncbi:hypothetical protein MMC27_007271 [Xylographa pallens]|nr:hypothetical protein [Xylographa pallens]
MPADSAGKDSPIGGSVLRNKECVSQTRQRDHREWQSVPAVLSSTRDESPRVIAAAITAGEFWSGESCGGDTRGYGGAGTDVDEEGVDSGDVEVAVEEGGVDGRSVAEVEGWDE